MFAKKYILHTNKAIVLFIILTITLAPIIKLQGPLKNEKEATENRQLTQIYGSALPLSEATFKYIRIITTYSVNAHHCHLSYHLISSQDIKLLILSCPRNSKFIMNKVQNIPFTSVVYYVRTLTAGFLRLFFVENLCGKSNAPLSHTRDKLPNHFLPLVPTIAPQEIIWVFLVINIFLNLLLTLLLSIEHQFCT